MAATTAPTALAPVPAAAAAPPPSPMEPAPPPPPAIGEPPEGPPDDSRAPVARGRAARRALAVLALLAFLLLGSADKVDGPAGRRADPGAGAGSGSIGAGLDVEVKRRTDQAPRDFVFEQSPNPGQEVDKGSVVTLFVSNGPSTVKVPDVVGLRARRTRAGVCAVRTCGRTSSGRASTKVAEGIVIRTDPGPGRPAERDSAVTLVVSSGPEQVERPERDRARPRRTRWRGCARRA